MEVIKDLFKNDQSLSIASFRFFSQLMRVKSEEIKFLPYGFQISLTRDWFEDESQGVKAIFFIREGKKLKLI